jgi:hypothetical protein
MTEDLAEAKTPAPAPTPGTPRPPRSRPDLSRHILPIDRPPFRRLNAYAFDPSLSIQLENVALNRVVLQVPWEVDPDSKRDMLQPGPVGEYLAVVDIDPPSQCFYAPVDLNNPYLLARDGLPPAENLFQVDPNDTAAARTLAVNDAFAPEMLAAAAPGPPYVSNGTALKLASLARSQDPADEIAGAGFLEFYAGIAAGTGRSLADARDASVRNADLVAQARAFRQEAQGVSFDEEALALMEYQRAYQASAQVITTLNEITDLLVNLIR